MSAITPEPNEVWQEADSCCLLYVGNDYWIAFGNEKPFKLNDVEAVTGEPVLLPLRRLLDTKGHIAPEQLDEWEEEA